LAFITIDLGTTNIKVTAFTDQFSEIGSESSKVIYQQEQDHWVEFDAEAYFDHLQDAIARLRPQIFEPVHQIILTGQAESLVVLDSDGKPLRQAISWLDMRSTRESERIKEAFPEDQAYAITGQPANTPTWPITKILWLKENEPDIFKQAGWYVLVKDYIHYRLTGKMTGEYSIYNFSYYFDIHQKDYWMDLLNWCGVRREQLPELVEPCTTTGLIMPQVAEKTGLDPSVSVNIGTLDHFAGMIGTGNIRQGIISESTGTVVALATLVDKPVLTKERIPCHYGPFLNSYVLLPVCESGGVCLEWFRDTFASDLSYKDIDQLAVRRNAPADLLFLPYLTGTNSPEYNTDAKGVFYGIRLKHDRGDFASAVMEGVAYLLNRNLAALDRLGIHPERVITTGGGSKSSFWCQTKANLTGIPFSVPVQTEAASLGCALIGAVACGVAASYEKAIEQCVAMKKVYQPEERTAFARQNRRYDQLYQQMLPVFEQDAAFSLADD
jgi:sugar (pentulose or hexulose) kinase